MSGVSSIRNQQQSIASPSINGASSTIKKVAAIAIVLIAALVSFLFLSWEAALFTTITAAALFSMCCCSHQRGAQRSVNIQIDPQRPPIFSPRHVSLFPPVILHPRERVSVVNQGAREEVGDGHLYGRVHGSILRRESIVPDENRVNTRPIISNPEQRGDHVRVGGRSQANRSDPAFSQQIRQQGDSGRVSEETLAEKFRREQKVRDLEKINSEIQYRERESQSARERMDLLMRETSGDSRRVSVGRSHNVTSNESYVQPWLLPTTHTPPTIAQQSNTPQNPPGGPSEGQDRVPVGANGSRRGI